MSTRLDKQGVPVQVYGRVDTSSWTYSESSSSPIGCDSGHSCPLVLTPQALAISIALPYVMVLGIKTVGLQRLRGRRLAVPYEFGHFGTYIFLMIVPRFSWRQLMSCGRSLVQPHNVYDLHTKKLDSTINRPAPGISPTFHRMANYYNNDMIVCYAHSAADIG